MTAADQAALAAAKTDLSEVDTVKSVTFLGESADGRAAQLLVVSTVTPFDQSGGTTLVNHLQSALGKVPFPAGTQAHLAGQLATDAANQKQSQKQGNLIQGLSILLIIVLLLIIFRALLAPLVTCSRPYSSWRSPGRSSVAWARSD
ncbi:MAG: MMPL family transporter [Acidimicrobiales bacterium]